MISVSVQFHKDGIHVLSCNYLIIYVLWYMYIACKCSCPTLLICTWKVYMSCYQKPIIKNIDMTYAFIITPTIWCDRKWNGKSWHGINECVQKAIWTINVPYIIWWRMQTRSLPELNILTSVPIKISM